MSDEIFLEGKNYVSSKKAATTTGYAQDYIGQLSRGGLIDAQRVGGLWYVSLESLSAYQKNAEEFKPIVPAPKQASDLDSIVSFDGKDYISASRASKLTTYNQDYIGQLARGGKILSRQIGNRWYIEREGLLAHKSQKDSLLAAVQAEAVGLTLPKLQHQEPVKSSPLLQYSADARNLMPTLEKKPNPVESELRTEYNIPIRVMRTAPSLPQASTSVMPRRGTSYVAPSSKKVSDIAISRAIQAGVALTFVIVLSYGFVTLKQKSLYAFNFNTGTSKITNNAFTANATAAATRLGDILEHLIAPELSYKRIDQ